MVDSKKESDILLLKYFDSRCFTLSFSSGGCIYRRVNESLCEILKQEGELSF